MNSKSYILYAGVNGVGKSSLYRTNGNFHGYHYVNLDDEIRMLGDWRDISINMKAGKQVINTIHNYLSSGESFIQETTFCGNSIIRNIEFAAKSGYYIEVHFVAVDSPEIAIERVHKRVAKGGHGVSDEDIFRRYYQSFENLKKLLPIIDLTFLYDNTVSFRNVAIYSKSVLISKENQMPEWFGKYM